MSVSALDGFPLLAGLPDREQELIAAVLQPVEIEAGRALASEGDFGWALYVVEAGEADVRSHDGDLVATLGPGDTFGEVALLMSGRRTASVVATTPMRLQALFTQDFQRLRDDVPELEAALRRLIAERRGE